jgi:hypothetical protein
MDEDRVAGTVPESGRNAQGVYGRARDSTSGAAESASEAGSPFERQLRNTIEQKPYIALAIAMGIGWLLGRSRRPL